MNNTLKELRKKCGLTQAEASQITDIPLRTYINYENDSSKAGSIKYADNEGDISTSQQAGQNMVGGIAGHLNGALVTVENCNNTGNVSDEMSSHVTKYRCVGGIVGRAQGASGKIVSVKNCTNTGTISANLNTDNQLANCGFWWR